MNADHKKLCIFDWNGTLQDDLHHIYECGVERIFREFKLRCPSIDEYRNEVTADFMTSFYHPHGIPKDVTADQLNAIMGEGFKEKAKSAPIFEDAEETVTTLKEWGYDIAVVSGYAQDKLDKAIERSGLKPYIAEAFGDVRDKNPVYEGLAREFMPDTLIGVGDTIEDAMATIHVGGLAFLCHRGFHTKERLVSASAGLENVYLIDTLFDLLGELA